MNLSSLRRAAALSLVAVATTVLMPVPGVSAVPPGSTSAATEACGGSLPKTTGGLWTCTFADEFAGTDVDRSKWLVVTSQQTGLGAPGCSVATKNNVSVGGGALRLTVRKESKAFTCPSLNGSYSTRYTSGGATTWGKFAQAYGRFEIRARFPSVKVAGVHGALWLWPWELKYNGAGEIDIAEFFTAAPDRVIPYLHYRAAVPDPNVTNINCMVNRPEDYHIYLLEWSPQAMTISYDGQVCLHNDNWQPYAPYTKPQPFDRPVIISLTNMLGVSWNAFDAATTPLPATMQVDYVRVWK